MKLTRKQLKAIVEGVINEKMKGTLFFKIKNSMDSSSSIKSSDKSGKKGSLKDIKYVSVPNRQAAENAMLEFSAWKNGKLKEKKKEAYPLLKKYWDDLGNWPESRWNIDTAWSAAFISYVMKKSGDNFYDSAAHTTYATKALKNREALLKDPKSLTGVQHVLFLKGEAEPEVGDTMFYVREGTLEDWMSSGGGEKHSHTDIFIGNGKGIGGNLSNTVSKTRAMFKHQAIIKKVRLT